MESRVDVVARAPAARESALGELRQLWRLAFPLILGQAGNQLMSVVDTAFVGSLGATQLAGMGIGASLYFCLAVLGLGIVQGMEAPVSQAVGAGELVQARRILWQGIRVALLATVPLMAVAWVLPFLLGPCGVDPGAADEATRYLRVRSWNMLPFLLFCATRSYLQANHATRPIVIAVVFANAVNAIFDALLIHGDRALAFFGLPGLGLPALGVVGCGLASTLAWMVSLSVLVLAVALLDAPPDPERRRRDGATLHTIVRLGMPMGAQFLAEVGVFTIVSILMGRLSAEAAAGHQLALTLASATFCVTVGIASAASVRVGHAIGRQDVPGVRRAALAAFGSSGAFMSLTALLLLFFPATVGGLLTSEASVLEAAIPLIMIAAVFQISDGTQAVATGVLRAAGDARAPLYANLVGHYAVGLTIALVLSNVLGLGARGLWWGLSAGLTAVAIGLTARFFYLSSRPIARVLA